MEPLKTTYFSLTIALRADNGEILLTKITRRVLISSLFRVRGQFKWRPDKGEFWK